MVSYIIDVLIGNWLRQKIKKASKRTILVVEKLLKKIIKAVDDCNDNGVLIKIKKKSCL